MTTTGAEIPTAAATFEHAGAKSRLIEMRDDDLSGELDLSALWAAIRRHWMLVIIYAAAGTLLAAVAAFTLPKRYEAAVLVAPNLESDAKSLSVSAALDQLGGGLAGLIGNRGSRSRLNVEIIKSDSFALMFLRKYRLEGILFPDRWDSATGHWKADARVPTDKDLVGSFARIRNISEDNSAGTVRVAIRTPDPTLSSRLASAFIDEANALIRAQTIRRTEENIKYLNAQYQQVQITDVRNTISQLVLSELREAMTARTDPEFAFRVIDRPLALTRRDFTSPNRPVLIALGFLGGGFAGVFIAAARGGRKRRRHAL